MSERSERSEATSQEEKMKSNLKIIGVWSLSGIVVLWTLHFCFVGPGVDWWKDFSLSDLQTQPRVVYPNPQPSVSVRQTSQSSSAGSSSSGGGLREETEKITLAYDGRADKFQDTRNLEFTVPPLPVSSKKSEGGDNAVNGSVKVDTVDTSKMWTQWIIAPTGPYMRYTLYQPELGEGEVMYYQFWYENDPRPMASDSFLTHRTNVPDAVVTRPVFAYRFRNPNNRDVVMVSQIRNR